MPQRRFGGIDRLYGAGALHKLMRAHVCVVGVGGVGSWAAEALARSGVGRLTIIDADEVCVSNTNRQSHALVGAYGRPKVEVLAERLRAINPELDVAPIARFVTPTTLPELMQRGYDYVFDACDAFRVKLEMCAYCRRNKIPILVCGAAGGRTDPTRIIVRDLSRTEHDKLLGMIRKKLRDEYDWTRNPDRYFGVQAVFSLENVRYPQPDGSVCATRPSVDAAGALKLDCGQGLGAAMHVTAAFAMAGVAKIIERLLGSS
jgi:tRNA A37 threonylcarbamoyladenosine dehydratase